MRLPVGYDNFQEVVKKKLDFIDKTLFIKAVLDDDTTKVAVITRPRRFGKTLNLSMLQNFLSQKVNGKETRSLFEHLKIAQCGNAYIQHQGKYPVVFLTFKDINELTFKDACEKFIELFVIIYDKYNYLLSSKNLSDTQKYFFENVLKRKITKVQLKDVIRFLTNCVFTHHRVKPWLLIDEYDTPIQSGYVNQYYDLMIDLMRGMLGAALKTNEYLEKAVITGILRVAKESLFSGVNNLEVYSLLRKEYSEYFGFTEQEVDKILKKSGLLGKAEEIKAWYNGYKAGETVIYNPWSIANCVKRAGEIKPYWVNTSDNQLIKDLLKKSPIEFKHQFELLISEKSIEKLIDEHMVFQYLNDDASAIWSLLLMAGYLKPVSSRQTYQGTYVQLAIPNMEVRNLYRQIVEQWLSNGYGIEWYNDFIHSLLNGNMEDFKKHLEKVVLQIASYHDFAKEPEAFYQGLILGFTVSLHGWGTHEIMSNRESGLGRCDIVIIPKDTSKPGIVIELKSSRERKNLVKVSRAALEQIKEKEYSEMFRNKGLKEVLKIGIGFSGKAFETCSEREIF